MAERENFALCIHQHRKSLSMSQNLLLLLRSRLHVHSFWLKNVVVGAADLEMQKCYSESWNLLLQKHTKQ